MEGLVLLRAVLSVLKWSFGGVAIGCAIGVIAILIHRVKSMPMGLRPLFYGIKMGCYPYIVYLEAVTEDITKNGVVYRIGVYDGQKKEIVRNLVWESDSRATAERQFRKLKNDFKKCAPWVINMLQKKEYAE